MIVMMLALFASMAATSANAQYTPESDQTVVTAQSPSTLRKEVADYVQQLGIVTGEQAASRWIDRVCPEIVGLSAEQAARVEAQLRETAAAVGAPLAEHGCKGNLVVAFTSDPGAVVRQISQRQYLGAVTYQRRERLETGSEPIRWWYNYELLGEDGSPTEGVVLSPQFWSSGDAAQEAELNYNVITSTGRAGMTNGPNASLIVGATMRVIKQATVVIDARQASTNALTSLVDYATLVGLAEVQAGAAPHSSILDLFNTGEFHRLSRNDLALLKGLYSLNLARKADQHRRALITRIVEDRARPH